MLASPQIHLLTEIHRIEDPSAQRGAFRKAMADLSAMVAEQHPVPLEGLDPQALQRGLAACLDRGLFDGLTFIAAPSALVAMYQLASYLPKGETRSALSRRISDALKGCDGSTFAALSAALAIGSTNPFTERTLRARVELSLELSSRTERRAADALSLSLISRPQLQSTWLVVPATSSLPARRRSALILERAAREAARRHDLGDDGVLQVFVGETVRNAFLRLLNDRESLVWRHVAVARGLLAPLLPELDLEVSGQLDPALSPTEWRRAAVSEVASIAARAEQGLARCQRILQGPLPKRDRGLPGAMIFGIARAAEAEPRAALALLLQLIEQGGEYALETLSEALREETIDPSGRAQRLSLSSLERLLSEVRDDPTRAAVLQLFRAQLVPAQAAGDAGAADRSALPDALAGAMRELAVHGPQAAARAAVQLLSAAEARLAGLLSEPFGHRSLQPLWELDRVLLQSTTLDNLLRLDADADRALRRLEQLREGLHRCLLRAESQPGDIPLHMRRLVSLLHSVDAESVDHAGHQRRRQLDTVRTLLGRVPESSASPLDRVRCATLARAFDALVESGLMEVSDILLAAARFVRHERGLRTLAEASMDPQLEQVLDRYANLLVQTHAMGEKAADRDRALHALQDVLQVLPVSNSPRTEALRQTTVHLFRALESLLRAPSLRALCAEPYASALPRLGDAAHTLAQLSLGAARRFYLVQDSDRVAQAGQCVFALHSALEGAVLAEEAVPFAELLPRLERAFRRELPLPLAELAVRVVSGLLALPLSAAPGAVRSMLPQAPTRRLPAWLPPSHVLGGFYVIDTLGEGAVGSVFVATRLEDRGRMGAPCFALKVPTYDGRAARVLSEQEFLDSFRKEAGALLSLPGDHPNIAAFVTFDAGAIPKPVLVMELVRGPSLARRLSQRRLDTGRALSLLLGAAQGLCTMHGLGLGHLDVKPANIIVRAGDDHLDGGEDLGPRAVLVDFGLSGRGLRPGCATAAYGAPEIWGLLPEPDYADPRPADVYAFACTAFEVLCGQDLFAGHDDMALISSHITHDGMPARLERLRERPSTRPLCDLLSAALRRDPRERISMAELRGRLLTLQPALSAEPWPLLPNASPVAA